ncbi:hypothetical protein [Rhizobium leguminosarum]|uniref:hypothetical protein n=1 Tax=Rhizobium leguminosarum TaxID=384 RepID=UPI0013BBF952|nr:hypothetical protein [Rhizobium leguminosarum]NEI61264.1 hypothetical protein [Rhizobium leguminosarum]
MQYEDQIAHRVRPDFSCQQARVDLPLVLQALPEPYRYPAAFMAIAGRLPSEVLYLRTVQFTEAARLPPQGNRYLHFFHSHRAGVQLEAGEVDFLTHYVTEIRPGIVDRARKRGRSPSDYLFIRDDGGPISLTSFDRTFRQISKQLGLRQTLSPGKIRALRYREEMAALSHSSIQESLAYVSGRRLLEIIDMRLVPKAETTLISPFKEAGCAKPPADNNERR